MKFIDYKPENKFIKICKSFLQTTQSYSDKWTLISKNVNTFGLHQKTPRNKLHHLRVVTRKQDMKM